MFRRLALLCAAFVLASPTVHAAFYKHIDANGVVTYGNRAPESSPPVSVPPVEQGGPERFVEVRQGLYGAMAIDPEQKRRNSGLLASAVPAADATVLQASLANRALRDLLAQSLRTAPARPPSPVLLSTSDLYPLPWRGGPFRVSQGPNGDYSHNTRQGRYAIDIAMPEGTPIIAARAGQVIGVHDGQVGRAGSPSGNHVRIRHEDGTQGVYLHLQKDSIGVRQGQWVALGEALGRSGNTGNSTGPHLHFAVQRQLGAQFESIPFAFSEPLAPLPNFAQGGD
ncbi:MAG: peptidoglycan DD-metalloendopeptidase family protein [Pseudomonadota bacterium]